MNGTCEQLFSRLLFPATANFQKREYAKTKIATATMLSTVLELGVSQGAAKKFRIGRAHKPEKARFTFGAQREGNLTALRLINS